MTPSLPTATANGHHAAPGAPSGPRFFLGMPGYGDVTAGASRAFWRATRRPDSEVWRQYNEGSLLAANFNALWCAALNLAARGMGPAYFAMQHADVEPDDWWLDALVAEMEANDLDVLGVGVPIKDRLGLTSTALARDDGDTWRIHARLTMTDLFRLPETFTSEDVGRPLLLNTGLWVCKFDPAWARKVHFQINDRIVVGPDGVYRNECEPEDWYFSRLLHELGLKVGCTRKIKLTHRGPQQFTNAAPWGQPFDSAYLNRSPLPEPVAPAFVLPDIDGWLRPAEGAKLAELAEGKRVLEVGSYLGLSTVCLARTAAEVVSVDPHDGRATHVPQDTYFGLLQNLERFGVDGRVTAWVGTFASALEHHLVEADGFDLVFIDGDHSYASVADDIARALPLLAPGGLVAFHDYRSPQDPGVTAAVDELLRAGGELLTLTDSLAVVRPPAHSRVPAPMMMEA